MDIDEESDACYHSSSPAGKDMELVWKCNSCGYLHLNAESPPDACPDCGKTREHFELVEED